jgi:hypothetical protein
MRVALVCIAKDEDNYIEEWIKYNFKLGFDDIFVYQNNWRLNIEMDNVHKVEFDGKGIQPPAYNHFIQSNHTQYDWVAFFDVDEFLVLKKHQTIKEFISSYADYDAIGINWFLFGDSNLKFDGNYSLINRFKFRQSRMNEHVKCILKMNKNIQYDIHCPINCSIVDTDFNLFNGSFNPNGKDDVAQLNHYFCKTLDEWQQKKNRGRPNTYEKRTDDDFHNHNFNEVEDTLALNFYLS